MLDYLVDTVFGSTGPTQSQYAHDVQTALFEVNSEKALDYAEQAYERYPTPFWRAVLKQCKHYNGDLQNYDPEYAEHAQLAVLHLNANFLRYASDVSNSTRQRVRALGAVLGLNTTPQCNEIYAHYDISGCRTIKDVDRLLARPPNRNKRTKNI